LLIFLQSGLVTAATDGRVNFWSLANLREPAETMQVGDSVSCFSVAPESEALLLGDEYGAMYTVQSSGQGGQRSSRKQTHKMDTVDESGENNGHFGMVTSLSTKMLKKGASSRAAGLSKGFLRGSGGLVLSSGVDWTVKLWAPAYSDAPLISLVSHSYDYMSDVKWSPTHSSLFATASSNGTVGLWNLATSFEDPLTGTDGIVVEPDAMSGRGLNKLKWSSDGRRLAVASGDRMHVLSLSEEVARQKGDEDSKVMNELMSRGLVTRQ
jgi:dynein intermediate chain